MFEYVIQGVARAGGVEMPAGRTVLPVPKVVQRRPGILRRSTGQLLLWGARSLQSGAARLLEPRIGYRAAS